MNPSKRKAKGIFLIRIGNGFIVDTSSCRLDKLEPPICGTNTPEEFIIGEARDEINSSPCFKDFKVTVTIEIEPWKGLPSPKVRENRVNLWMRKSNWEKRAGR